MSNNSVKKRKLDKRSRWWQFFDEIKENYEAKCNIENCSNPIVIFKGKSTALERHVKNNHNQKYIEMSNIVTIDRTFSGYEKKEISKYTVLMMIMENRPFDIINGNWYKLMMNKIQINWNSADHKTLDKYINEIYDEVEIGVKSELKEQIFFCQTSDGWKSKANDHYYSINLHYINCKWEYCSINLGTIPIEEDHITGEVISKEYDASYV